MDTDRTALKSTGERAELDCEAVLLLVHPCGRTLHRKGYGGGVALLFCASYGHAKEPSAQLYPALLVPFQVQDVIAVLCRNGGISDFGPASS